MPARRAGPNGHPAETRCETRCETRHETRGETRGEDPSSAGRTNGHCCRGSNQSCNFPSCVRIRLANHRSARPPPPASPAGPPEVGPTTRPPHPTKIGQGRPRSAKVGPVSVTGLLRRVLGQRGNSCGLATEEYASPAGAVAATIRDLTRRANIPRERIACAAANAACRAGGANAAKFSASLTFGGVTPTPRWPRRPSRARCLQVPEAGSGRDSGHS